VSGSRYSSPPHQRAESAPSRSRRHVRVAARRTCRADPSASRDSTRSPHLRRDASRNARSHSRQNRSAGGSQPTRCRRSGGGWQRRGSAGFSSSRSRLRLPGARLASARGREGERPARVDLPNCLGKVVAPRSGSIPTRSAARRRCLRGTQASRRGAFPVRRIS
jgi:hypothetical protein